jgi:hypothetical protein
MKKNLLFNLFFTLISVCFFSFESKAVSGYKSAPQDTCVTIKMKDGNEISVVIVEKTAQKVRFRKCGSEVTDTVFFVPNSKIVSISQPQTEYELDNSNSKENREKIRKIKTLVTTSYLSGALFLASFVLIESISFSGFSNLSVILLTLFYMISGISTIWALIELLSYKGQFEDKKLLVGLLIWKVVTFLLTTLLFIALLYSL